MSPSYFQSYQGYFWEWENATEVASVRGEKTIAYREFLFQIIDKLSPQGLPPFGSLLLAIAATNPEGLMSIEHIRRLTTVDLKAIDQETLTSALIVLKLLAALPPAYKVKEKRILLLQAIFEDCHNRFSQKESMSISTECKQEAFSLEKATVPQEFISGIFRHDFRPIAVLNNKFKTVEDIIKKIGALPDVGTVELEPVKNPSTHEPNDFVDELIETEATFHVGSLIRWLWGGLNIPVHSALPSQQPLGGISDLTNKGNFDKLLISEFAYDDITLLSRLANNEALYLHREVPPANNDLNRIILIDATIKNWGNPKTVAFALALAISRHPKTDIICHSYVLGNKTYYPVSIENIHHVIEALQIAEASLHPAESLALFFADHGTDPNMEIIFIMETSVKHKELLKVMNDHYDALNYVVFTDAGGNVEVHKKHQRARKLVQRIKLPLEQLWRKNNPNESKNIKRPALQSELPLLLKVGRAKCLVSAPDGEIFQIDEDLSILKLYDPGQKREKGWELVYENLPFKSNHFEIGLSEKGEYIALLFSPQTRQALLINLSSGQRKSVEFRRWRNTAWPSFVFDSGKFYHLNSNGGWSISVDGTLEGPAHFLQHHKFIERGDQFKELTKQYSLDNTLFKNIVRVFIDNSERLVLNIHGLSLNDGYLRLVPASGGTVRQEGKKISASEFQFSDGSVVKINRSGFVVLTSSNRTIPPIYIPTTLESTLGVATEMVFAGNAYYYKENRVKLNLESAGPNKIHAARLTVAELKVGLAKAKELIDNTPSLIPGSFTPERAEEIKSMYATNGARVEILKTPSSVQTKINIQDFYRNFITPFISNIIRHGV